MGSYDQSWNKNVEMCRAQTLNAIVSYFKFESTVARMFQLCFNKGFYDRVLLYSEYVLFAARHKKDANRLVLVRYFMNYLYQNFSSERYRFLNSVTENKFIGIMLLHQGYYIVLTDYRRCH